MTSSRGRESGRFRARDLSAPWRHVDVTLLVVVGVIVVLGSAMVYSATRKMADPSGFVVRQGLFVVLGIGLMCLVSLIDYRRIADWWQILYALSIALLLGVMTPLGAVVNGSRGWYRFGPFSMQPAEFAKLAAIISVATYLGSSDRVDLRRLAVALGLLGVPAAMVLVQPDLGSALVFIVIALGMLVVAGVRMRHLVVLVALGAVAVFAILTSGTLDQYQKDRLTSFVTPNGQSYNVDQAQKAIGSGGLTGYGYMNGPQTRGGYVPEQETDFIFTVAGEELGFVGAGGLVVLLGVLVWRIWRNAQLAADALGTLICVGIMSMFLFHIFENIGMTLGIMPVTGIPLPFVSYGGSSLMTSFTAVGLVQSVHMHRYT
ncbi:MAG: rod shape-determining protein RodA [Actinobacteria bacterium]|nr:rod shape-determining protein RodA [Actinomycetota bacterium]